MAFQVGSDAYLGEEQVRVMGIATADGQLPVVNAKGFPSWVPEDQLVALPETSTVTVDIGGKQVRIQVRHPRAGETVTDARAQWPT
jgi:hypothetical protein